MFIDTSRRRSPSTGYLPTSLLAGRSAHDRAGRLRESIEHLGRRYKIHYLQVLLGKLDATAEGTRASRVLLLRAGDERVAVLVDEVLGSREIMVKNVGPQIGSVHGILGATVLGDGRGVLIINPIEFARRGDFLAIPAAGAAHAAEAGARTPLVLVVDDSLTVRKFTTRLLAREGFRVATARDGARPSAHSASCHSFVKPLFSLNLPAGRRSCRIYWGTFSARPRYAASRVRSIFLRSVLY
ncbi:MAG: chemotaxis protein CheW, partial [Gammaproteobacteria bacterium]